MSQQTLVLKLLGAQQLRLRERLNAGAYEWRKTPHARFSVKGEGVVATLYNSGKLVIQGADPEAWAARVVEGDAKVVPGKGASARDERESGDRVSQVLVTTVGSDETGKGDYFGPLVVAAVRLEPELATKMAEGGVMDSKKLTDGRALELGAALRQWVAHEVVRVDPEEYNRRYAGYSGLNAFLADLHAEAIAGVAQEGDRVLVDKFASDAVMKKALKKTLHGLDIQFEQATRAERNPAVAAASILARQEFLLALAELGERFGVALHKGRWAADRRGGDFVCAGSGDGGIGQGGEAAL